MDINLRKATRADAKRIEQIVAAAYERYLPQTGRKPRPMLVNYETVIDEHEFWVLERSQSAIAVLELIDGGDHLLVESVAVMPDQQGQGLGRRLLAWAEQRAAVYGYAEVRLYTNALFAENIAVYNALGYIETHREALNGGVAVLMLKTLDNL